MQTEELAAAYGAFVAEATAGGFGPPPPGEWDARQLVAHLAVNDGLLAETAERVLAGEPARFDNSTAVDWTKVTAFADEHGNLAGGLDALRASAARLCGLASRLDERQAAIDVHVFIQDGAEIAVDQPMPLGRLLGIQASFHLPAHHEQLAALRPDAGPALG
jgi:hypothetical protein